MIPFFFVLNFIFLGKNSFIGVGLYIICFFIKYFLRFVKLNSSFLCMVCCVKIFQKLRKKIDASVFEEGFLFFSKKSLKCFCFFLKNFFNVFLSSIEIILFQYMNFRNTSNTCRLLFFLFKKNYSIRINSSLISGSFKKQVTKSKKNSENFTNLKKIFDEKHCVIDISSFLTKITNLLYQYDIKGLTRGALKIIIIELDTYCKEIALNLSKIAMKRKTQSRIKLEHWGKENIIINKRKKFSFIFQEIINSVRKQKIISKQLSCFKKMKKGFNFCLEKVFSDFTFFKTEKATKKQIKYDNYLENLKKTNKTLEALLKGILQRRVCILKEATKCLHTYKPLTSEKKKFKRKEKKTISKQKMRAKIFTKKTKICFFSKEVWCTGKDCIRLLDIENDNKPLIFLKWFLYLCNDYNHQRD